MFGIKVQIDGLEGVMRRLRQVDQKVQKKILRQSLNKGAALVVKEARNGLPPGLLKKAMGKKTQVYRSSGIVVVIIGARRGMSGMFIPKGHKKPRKQDPSKIAHLAGPGRRQVFMTRAADTSVERARSVIIEAILQGIERA